MDQKAPIADRLKQANNILVTVSNNPSVDQLAACIGLTLALNKLGKHATAVFSGQVPNTLEFLQPEKTLEKNTDSLRDFIIALDKSKADKLRYKVEDKVVKIFITPYRTSISQKDLDFSQGDFNVDVVVALGVHNQQDLDAAITSHGRILHDAVVATVNVKPGGDLGSINWLDTNASSLSELVVELIDAIDHQLVDGQMATALLTGIVAETHRFSNDRTSPTTMSIAAELMSAGANQQLVAAKLEPPAPPPQPAPAPQAAKEEASQETKPADDGTLEITHDGEQPAPPEPSQPAEPPAEEEKPEEPLQQIHIDEHGALHTIEEQEEAAKKDKGTIDPTQHMESGRMILQPPASMAGDMGMPGMPDDTEHPSGDPLSLPSPSGPMSDGPSFAPPASAAAANHTGPTLMPSALPHQEPTPPPPPTSAPAPLSMPGPLTPPTPPTSVPQPGPVLPPPPAPAPPTPTFPQPSFNPAPASPPSPTPLPPPSPTSPAIPPPPSETLEQIEQDVHSPHVYGGPASTPAVGAGQIPPAFPPSQPITPPPSMPSAAAGAPAPTTFSPPPPPVTSNMPEPATPDLASARDAVMQAIASQPSSPGTLEPIQALNAQPLGSPLHDQPGDASIPGITPGSIPSVIQPTDQPNGPASGSAPPPLPPPMMPPAA